MSGSTVKMFHLNRIGPPATKPGVVDVMDFEKVTSLIGRNKGQVDFVLDSTNHVASQYISRLHSRVVRQENNSHRLFDDSLNGIFINNTKIMGSVVLQEGDIVTFGHPYGVRLKPGVWARQPDSEYQFIFERCNCDKNKTAHGKATVLEDRVNTTYPTVFKKPQQSTLKVSPTPKDTVAKLSSTLPSDQATKTLIVSSSEPSTHSSKDDCRSKLSEKSSNVLDKTVAKPSPCNSSSSSLMNNESTSDSSTASTDRNDNQENDDLQSLTDMNENVDLAEASTIINKCMTTIAGMTKALTSANTDSTRRDSDSVPKCGISASLSQMKKNGESNDLPLPAQVDEPKSSKSNESILDETVALDNSTYEPLNSTSDRSLCFGAEASKESENQIKLPVASLCFTSSLSATPSTLISLSSSTSSSTLPTTALSSTLLSTVQCSIVTAISAASIVTSSSTPSTNAAALLPSSPCSESSQIPSSLLPSPSKPSPLVVISTSTRLNTGTSNCLPNENSDESNSKIEWSSGVSSTSAHCEEVINKKMTILNNEECEDRNPEGRVLGAALSGANKEEQDKQTSTHSGLRGALGKGKAIPDNIPSTSQLKSNVVKKRQEKAFSPVSRAVTKHQTDTSVIGKSHINHSESVPSTSSAYVGITTRSRKRKQKQVCPCCVDDNHSKNKKSSPSIATTSDSSSKSKRRQKGGGKTKQNSKDGIDVSSLRNLGNDSDVLYLLSESNGVICISDDEEDVSTSKKSKSCSNDEVESFVVRNEVCISITNDEDLSEENVSTLNSNRNDCAIARTSDKRNDLNSTDVIDNGDVMMSRFGTCISVSEDELATSTTGIAAETEPIISRNVNMASTSIRNKSGEDTTMTSSDDSELKEELVQVRGEEEQRLSTPKSQVETNESGNTDITASLEKSGNHQNNLTKVEFNLIQPEQGDESERRNDTVKEEEIAPSNNIDNERISMNEARMWKPVGGCSPVEETNGYASMKSPEPIGEDSTEIKPQSQEYKFTTIFERNNLNLIAEEEGNSSRASSGLDCSGIGLARNSQDTTSHSDDSENSDLKPKAEHECGVGVSDEQDTREQMGNLSDMIPKLETKAEFTDDVPSSGEDQNVNLNDIVSNLNDSTSDEIQTCNINAPQEHNDLKTEVHNDAVKQKTQNIDDNATSQVCNINNVTPKVQRDDVIMQQLGEYKVELPELQDDAALTLQGDVIIPQMDDADDVLQIHDDVTKINVEDVRSLKQDNSITKEKQDHNVTPRIENNDVTQHVQSIDATPQMKDGSVVSGVKDDNITPTIKDDVTSQIVQEGDVELQLQEDDLNLTPRREDDNVTQQVQEENDTPQKQHCDVTPQTQKGDSASPIQDGNITQEIQCKDVLPLIQDGVTSQIQDGATPKMQDDDVTQKIQDDNSTPQVENECVTTQMEECATPQINDDENITPQAQDYNGTLQVQDVSPQMQDDVVIPQVQDDEVTPQIQDDDVTPHIQDDDDVTPQIQDGDVIPQIQDGDVTPQVQDDDVTPQIQDDVTPQIQDGNITPQVQDDDVIPQVQDDDVTPHVQDDDVTPQIQDDDVTPQVQDDDVTPQIQDGDVTPKIQDDDVTPQVQDDDVTPKIQDDDVTPQIQDDDVTPQIQDDDVTPQIQDDDVTPQIQDDDVTPQIQDDDVIPQVQDDDVTPQIQDDDVAPQIQDDDVTPQIQDDDVSPQIQDDDVTTHIQDDDVTPQIQDDDVTPQVQDDDVTPQIQDDDVTPQIQDDDVTPQIQDDDVTPQIQDDDVTPQIQDDDVTPQIQDDDVTPQIQDDDVSPQIHNDDVTPQIQDDVTSQIQDDDVTPHIQVQDDDVTSHIQDDDVTPLIQANDCGSLEIHGYTAPQREVDVAKTPLKDITTQMQGNDFTSQIDVDVSQIREDNNSEIQDNDNIQEIGNDNVTQQVGNEDFTQEIEDEDAIQQIENEDATQKIGNEDATQQIGNYDFTQEIEDEGATQRIGNEDVIQEIEDDDVTQQMGNEDATQEIEDEDATQQIGNEDATQRIGNDDATQKIGNYDVIQEIEDEDAAQLVGNEDATQRIGNDDATQNIGNYDVIQETEDDDATQQIGNEDVTVTQQIGDQNATQQIEDDDVTQQIGNEDATQEIGNYTISQQIEDEDVTQVGDPDATQQIENDVTLEIVDNDFTQHWSNTTSMAIPENEQLHFSNPNQPTNFEDITLITSTPAEDSATTGCVVMSQQLSPVTNSSVMKDEDEFSPAKVCGIGDKEITKEFTIEDLESSDREKDLYFDKLDLKRLNRRLSESYRENKENERCATVTLESHGIKQNKDENESRASQTIVKAQMSGGKLNIPENNSVRNNNSYSEDSAPVLLDCITDKFHRVEMQTENSELISNNSSGESESEEDKEFDSNDETESEKRKRYSELDKWADGEYERMANEESGDFAVDEQDGGLLFSESQEFGVLNNEGSHVKASSLKSCNDKESEINQSQSEEMSSDFNARNKELENNNFNSRDTKFDCLMYSDSQEFGLENTNDAVSVTGTGGGNQGKEMGGLVYSESQEFNLESEVSEIETTKDFQKEEDNNENDICYNGEIYEISEDSEVCMQSSKSPQEGVTDIEEEKKYTSNYGASPIVSEISDKDKGNESRVGKSICSNSDELKKEVCSSKLQLLDTESRCQSYRSSEAQVVKSTGDEERILEAEDDNDKQGKTMQETETEDDSFGACSRYGREMLSADGEKLPIQTNSNQGDPTSPEDTAPTQLTFVRNSSPAKSVFKLPIPVSPISSDQQQSLSKCLQNSEDLAESFNSSCCSVSDDDNQPQSQVSDFKEEDDFHLCWSQTETGSSAHTSIECSEEDCYSNDLQQDKIEKENVEDDSIQAACRDGKLSSVHNQTKCSLTDMSGNCMKIGQETSVVKGTESGKLDQGKLTSEDINGEADVVVEDKSKFDQIFQSISDLNKNSNRKRDMSMERLDGCGDNSCEKENVGEPVRERTEHQNEEWKSNEDNVKIDNVFPFVKDKRTEESNNKEITAKENIVLEDFALEKSDSLEICDKISGEACGFKSNDAGKEPRSSNAIVEKDFEECNKENSNYNVGNEQKVACDAAGDDCRDEVETKDGKQKEEKEVTETAYKSRDEVDNSCSKVDNSCSKNEKTLWNESEMTNSNIATETTNGIILENANCDSQNVPLSATDENLSFSSQIVGNRVTDDCCQIKELSYNEVDADEKVAENSDTSYSNGGSVANGKRRTDQNDGLENEFISSKKMKFDLDSQDFVADSPISLFVPSLTEKLEDDSDFEIELFPALNSNTNKSMNQSRKRKIAFSPTFKDNANLEFSDEGSRSKLMCITNITKSTSDSITPNLTWTPIPPQPEFGCVSSDQTLTLTQSSQITTLQEEPKYLPLTTSCKAKDNNISTNSPVFISTSKNCSNNYSAISKAEECLENCRDIVSKEEEQSDNFNGTIELNQNIELPISSSDDITQSVVDDATAMSPLVENQDVHFRVSSAPISDSDLDPKDDAKYCSDSEEKNPGLFGNYNKEVITHPPSSSVTLRQIKNSESVDVDSVGGADEVKADGITTLNSPSSSPSTSLVPSHGAPSSSSVLMSFSKSEEDEEDEEESNSPIDPTPPEQRRAKRESLYTAIIQELQRMNKDIRMFLSKDKPNVDQAIEVLEDLQDTPINSTALAKFPHILETLNKCRRYKQSEDVRLLSQRIYDRFKALVL